MVANLTPEIKASIAKEFEDAATEVLLAKTLAAAKKYKVPVPIIEGAFQFRVQSAKKPSYTGKILSVLRNQFGGHPVRNPKSKDQN